MDYLNIIIQNNLHNPQIINDPYFIIITLPFLFYFLKSIFKHVSKMIISIINIFTAFSIISICIFIISVIYPILKNIIQNNIKYINT